MADLAELFLKISEDAPCGENLEYDNARVGLDTKILGTPENQFTGEKALPPNWREVQKDSVELLNRSKDLQVILYLIRSLIVMEGVSGFRDGLNLLRLTVEAFWDSVHPQLDPDDGMDPTLRVNILEELVSQELILTPLSLEPLVESRSVGRFSWRDFSYATDRLPTPEGITKPEVSTIKAAFLDIDEQALQAMHQTIQESIELVNAIEASVSEKVGASEGPNLAALRTLLKDMMVGYEQMAGERLAGVASSTDIEIDDNDSKANGNVSSQVVHRAPGAIANRQDVLKTLDAICKYYAEYEPSSPVPVLLQRAKFLVTADFAAIVQNLLPDALSQLEVFKGPDPNQNSDY